MPRLRWSFALRVVVIYLFGGGLWVLFSDQLAAAVFSDPAHLTTVQTLKAWSYVLATGGLLYYFLQREGRRGQQTQQRLQHQLQELNTLNAVASAGARAANQDELFAAVTRIISQALYPDNCGVLLADPVHRRWQPHPSYHGVPPDKLARSYSFEQGLVGQVAARGLVRRAGNIREESHYMEGTPGVQSEIATPILVGDQVYGVLNAESRRQHAFNADDEQLLATIADTLALAIEKLRLLGTLQFSNAELSEAYDRTLEGWSRALELRDKETHGHTSRMVDLTLALAQRLELPAEDLPHIRRGVLLHDIGKLGVPDRILRKPGPLDDGEWELMRQHPQYAYDLLNPIAYLRPALEIPYSHHEHWNGRGYPQKLRGEEIPLAARLFAVVDVWDALQETRPYRLAWKRPQVVDYLYRQRRRQFDPRVVDAFLEMTLSEPGEGGCDD